MKLFFRAASLLLILTALVTPKAFAQRRALFETFTNSNEPCPDPMRAPYENAANSTASQEASKIVRLNYHVANLADELATLDNGGGTVDYRLTGVAPGAVIYTSAVDRTTLPDGERVDPPTSGTGSYSDWNSQIETDAGTSPEASVALNFATIDKTASSQYYKLHADMTVTANQDIADSLIIRYAITQDNVHWTECGNVASIQNDVVWQVTTQNTSNFVVFTGGVSAGATQHVTCDLFVDLGYPLLENPANMKFVAFLEDDGGGDYFVANAAILKKDLDTLQAPAPTLSFDETHISDSTLTPGEDAQIFYNSTNLPHGANAYYSINNGTTWNLIADTQYSPFTWVVPDSLTTQGKIKLVAVGDPNLVSIEQGTFTIGKPASVTFVSPAPGAVLIGDSSYTIRWTNYDITGNVSLKYSLADVHTSTFSTFATLQDNTDTFYTWTATDTSDAVEFELISDNDKTITGIVIDTIRSTFIPNGVAASTPAPSGLSITNVFPNPASNGEEMVIEYSEAIAKPLTLQVLDLLGRASPVMYSTDNQAIRLNTSSLMAGAYVLRVTDGTNVVSKRVEVIR